MKIFFRRIGTLIISGESGHFLTIYLLLFSSFINADTESIQASQQMSADGKSEKIESKIIIDVTQKGHIEATIPDVSKQPIVQSSSDDLSRLFLRDTEVLLNPKEIQLSIGFNYSIDENLRSFRKNRRRRIFIPLGVNYGLAKTLQINASLPLLYNKNEIISATNVNKSDKSGIGDLSVGMAYKLKPESNTSPAYTASLDITIPTGEIADPTDLNDLSSGAGFWGISSGIQLSKSIDPAVVFFNIGYIYYFSAFQFDSNIQPGSTIVYGYGAGLSVNNSVAFSGRISGSYQTETKINDRLVRGSSFEPISYIGTMSYRLNNNARLETVLRLGASEDATDIDMGVTYIRNI